MKIANVMLSAGLGGVEQAVLDYTEALAQAGHDVTAIVRANAAMLTPLRTAGVQVQPVKMPHFWSLFARKRLTDLLSEFDLVILHGNRAARLTRHMQAPPMVAVAHSRFFEVLSHFAGIVALTEPRLQELKKVTTIPLTHIPHFVRVPKKPHRREFANPPVIGTMGRFSHEKGHDVFLEALSILQRRGISVDGVIGGKGKEEAPLRARAKILGLAASVRFPGWVEDTHAFYEGIDIFCLPSRSESFSLTLLEAMAHGCPVVATTCQGPVEILEDGKNGLLVEGNATAIADAIQSLLEDADRAAKLGKAARKHTKEIYALPVIAERLDSLARRFGKRAEAA